MTINELLPIVIYILLIIFLTILIILGIKLIMMVDKTNKVIDDVEEKINSLNPVFKILDMTSTGLASGVTTIVESTIGLINKIFRKKEDEDYE